ncbi:MAG: porin [Bacteroidales bacterium]
MKNKNILILLFLLFIGSTSYSQVENEINEKATPVQEGFIVVSEEPASNYLPQDVLIITEDNHKKHHRKTKVRVRGQVDAQYDFSTAKDHRNLITKEDPNLTNEYNYLGAPVAPKDYAGFQIRRARLGADAYFKKRWSAHIGVALDLSNINTEYGNRRDYLDYAYIQKKLHFGWLKGILSVGYKKVKFGLEETTHPFYLTTVERSIATNYFNGVTLWDEGAGRPSGYVCTPLGVGNRHTGVQWEGKADWLIPKMNYYLAIANETFNPFMRPKGQNINRINYYGGLGYLHKKKNYRLNFGVNFAYLPKGIQFFPISDQKSHELYVFNPYMSARAGWLSIGTEIFIGHAEHGQFINGGFYDEGAPSRAENSPDANSLGINAMTSFRVFLWMEPYFRFAYLNSGGAGFSSGYLKDVLPNSNAPFENNNFDKGYSYTAGINFKIIPRKVRFSVEYQNHMFTDDLNYQVFINNPYTGHKVSNAMAEALINDSKYVVNTLRARLQIRF